MQGRFEMNKWRNIIKEKLCSFSISYNLNIRSAFGHETHNEQFPIIKLQNNLQKADKN